jgi:fructose-1,6-bisphosphatase/sedoheptulose 1,7-bisphosphatase-like protein
MTENTTTVTYQLLDRNLGVDLMRVTEAAALAASRWADATASSCGARRKEMTATAS